jgi:predicted PurR-regulated permease PerM
MPVMTEPGRPRVTDGVGIALAWALLVLLLYLVYLIVAPFLVPLSWAGVLSVVFYPVHARLAKRFGRSRAAVLTTLVITLLAIAPMVFVTSAFVAQALDAAGNLQRAFADGRLGWIDRAWDALQQRLPGSLQFDPASLIAEGAKRLPPLVLSQSGFLVRNVAGFVLNLVVTLFATFFLLRDSDQIMRTIRYLLPMDEPSREATLARTGQLISVGVVSAGVVAIVQGFLGGVIFAILGINSAVFWGVVMGICCLLPFGAWLIWLPAAIVLAAEGSVGRAITLAVLGFGVVSSADNFLRPILLSEKVQMNGLVIFISLLGGIGTFGMLGVVLGPVLVATAQGLLTGYVDSREAAR